MGRRRGPSCGRRVCRRPADSLAAWQPDGPETCPRVRDGGVSLPAGWRRFSARGPAGGLCPIADDAGGDMGVGRLACRRPVPTPGGLCAGNAASHRAGACPSAPPWGVPAGPSVRSGPRWCGGGPEDGAVCCSQDGAVPRSVATPRRAPSCGRSGRGSTLGVSDGETTRRAGGVPWRCGRGVRMEAGPCEPAGRYPLLQRGRWPQTPSSGADLEPPDGRLPGRARRIWRGWAFRVIACHRLRDPVEAVYHSGSGGPRPWARPGESGPMSCLPPGFRMGEEGRPH